MSDEVRKQTLAGLVVGHIHIDQFVDASRPQHGLVDALGMVGGGKDIDPFVGSMVEHTEKLVHLAVVVLVVFVSCATRHHGVKLVKEEQCRRVSLRILEDLLTSSLRHPKILIKEFSYFLMPCHQHGLRINLLV